jgi:putative spermidine/putrescine transport system permease protein
MKLERLRRIAPALPLLVLGLVCLIFPLLVLLHISLQVRDGYGFDNFIDVFSSSLDRTALGNSLQFAAWQMVLCVVIGSPIALALVKLEGRARSVVMSFINVASSFGGPGLAFAFMLLIGTTGVLTTIWNQLFGQAGFPSLGSLIGLNAIMLYVHLPLYLMLSLPSYSLLRNEWREAARMSGSGFWRFWRQVGIPTLAPFALGNGLQIFMWAMGAYAIPYVVTTSPASINLISIEIGRDLESSVFGIERAASLSVILMFLAIAMMWIYRTLQKRGEKIL